MKSVFSKKRNRQAFCKQHFKPTLCKKCCFLSNQMKLGKIKKLHAVAVHLESNQHHKVQFLSKSDIAIGFFKRYTVNRLYLIFQTLQIDFRPNHHFLQIIELTVNFCATKVSGKTNYSKCLPKLFIQPIKGSSEPLKCTYLLMNG